MQIEGNTKHVKDDSHLIAMHLVEHHLRIGKDLWIEGEGAVPRVPT